VPEERRQLVRRQADRDLIARVRGLAQSAEQADGKHLRHMRRHAIRHQCTVEIALRIGFASGKGDTWHSGEHRIKGRILDLSEQGCSLFTKQNLDIGQAMGLLIQIEGGTNIQANAVVRWTKAIPERHGFASGVQFERLTEAEGRALHAYLVQLDRTIGL
jgi:c-di-GMP-binding flagellar brake protein YcgR